MSLERIITEALHDADRYQPSPDLFTRVSRSIEEDRAHRRRLLQGGLWIVVSIAAIASFLRGLVRQSASGGWVVPTWSVEIVEAAVLVAVLLALGPAIRRFGHPFLTDVFHLSPETGLRFSRLLDIAYYLFFSGVILSDVDLASVNSVVPLPDAFSNGLSRFGVFLTAMGLAHALNLLLLPVVGLVFGSGVRRTRRRAAGSQAPPVSPRAAQADRVVTWITIGLAGLVAAGILVVAGVLVGVGLGS
jgi:hypothetical protein